MANDGPKNSSLENNINQNNIANSQKSTDNTKKNCQSNQTTNNNDLGLASFSYADYVLLSSTIAYALSEELNETDLQMFIAFLGMVASDLAIITTKRGVKKALSLAAEQNTSLDIVNETTTEEIVVGELSRMQKKKKIKKIKRKVNKKCDRNKNIKKK